MLHLVFTSPSVFSLFLAFMTMALLKIKGQLFCSISLNLGLFDIFLGPDLDYMLLASVSQRWYCICWLTHDFTLPQGWWYNFDHLIMVLLPGFSTVELLILELGVFLERYFKTVNILFLICCYSFIQCGPTFYNSMDCSTPGFPVLHHLPEFAQTHVHWVHVAIQPSHPLLFPSPPALNLFQHQDLFQWVGSSHQVAKILELQHQSFQWIFRVDFL